MLDEIKDYLLKTNLIETCVAYQAMGQYSAEEQRDIVQNTWLWILTYDEEKLNDAYQNKHLNALITRYLFNQIKTKNGEYYRTERKWRENKVELTAAFENIPE